MADFKFYTPDNAEGHAKEVLTGVQKKYGFVPNLFAYMAEAPYLIESYAYLSEILDKNTDLTPGQQHTALLAISVYNKCEFCTNAHRALGKANKANQQTLDAINNGQTIEDPKDRILVDTVRAMVDQRGWLKDEQIETFLNAGFTKRNIFDLVLITTIKTLSNYSNHLSLPETNPEFIKMIG